MTSPTERDRVTPSEFSENGLFFSKPEVCLMGYQVYERKRRESRKALIMRRL
jgi:hypothetical protein